MNFELDTRITHTLPDGTISQTGKDTIIRFIQRVNATNLDWKALNPAYDRTRIPMLPDSWAWVWLVQHGDYRGTFPRRVAAYYKKIYGIRVPDAFTQELGNLAKRHSSEPVTYTFEFVNSMDWTDGDFGDDGSCYWGNRAGAREMLENNGGLAVCFYADGDGVARAWVVPAEDVAFVFNGYGFSGDPTLLITQILADYFGLDYQRLTLANAGTSYGVLYINSAAGYAIGARANIETLEHHDFGWAEIYRAACANCGRIMDEDDTYTGADDNVYCDTCYYEMFTVCERCEETFWNEDVTWTQDDRWVCAYCLDRHYTPCDDCGEYAPNDDLQHTPDGAFCPHCAPDEPEPAE